MATASSSDLRSLPSSVAEVLKSTTKGLAGARVVRHALVSGLAVFWHKDSNVLDLPMTGLKPVGSEDYILEPADCAVRLAVHSTNDPCPSPCPLEATLVSHHLKLRLQPFHLQEMGRLSDILDVANRRNRYGRFRPPHWRTLEERRMELSHPASCESLEGAGKDGGKINHVAGHAVWQYAIRSVLLDIRARRGSSNAPR